jgi:DNA replication protein DnaC
MQIRLLRDGCERGLMARDLARARIPKAHWDVTLATIADEAPHKKVVQRFIENLVPNLKRGYGLYLWGEYGRGKTTSAVVIGKHTLAHSGRVLFVRGADIKAVLIEKPEFDEDENMAERLYSVDLLILDDIEGSGDAAWTKGALENLIRTRGSALRSTILTANLNPQQAKGLLGEGGVAFMQECILPVQVQGPYWRRLLAPKLPADMGVGA